MKAIVTIKKSERFPNKHAYRVGEETLLDMLLKRLHSVHGFDEILVFSKDPTIQTSYADTVLDHTEGIITDSIYFLIEEFGEFFVFAGDMPVVSPEFIQKMLDSYNERPLCPIHQYRTIEPLHSIYNKNIEKDLKAYIQKGGKSLYRFILQSDFDYIEIDKKYESNFLNVNHKEDIEKLRDFLNEDVELK